MNEDSDESRDNLLSFPLDVIFVIRSGYLLIYLFLFFAYRRPNIYVAVGTANRQTDVMCLFA